MSTAMRILFTISLLSTLLTSALSFPSARGAAAAAAAADSSNIGGAGGRFFPFPGYKFDPRVPMTCSNYPNMCKAKWSAGPDCCRNLCVDVKRDFFNCGACGKMCRFGQMCCGGKCVSVMYDKNNCGWCGNKCEKGSFCRYGMCSYA